LYKFRHKSCKTGAVRCKFDYSIVPVLHVAVLYFLFLISMCVLSIVIISVVHYLHLRGESQPFAAMPSGVSKHSC